MFRRWIAGLAALAFACPATTLAEPLTLDTLLGLEGFGRIAIDPSGEVAVFEERRARGDLPRYDLQPEGAVRYSCLYRIDLDRPQDVRPLLPMEADAGYTLGPFSPDGRRLAVFRLQGLFYRLGVVDLSTGRTVWTDVSPETGAWGRAVEWMSDDALVALGTPDGVLPPRLAQTHAVQRDLTRLWARAAAGEDATVSSGLNAPPPAPTDRRLWRVDATTGAATPLADGPFLDVEVSPNGRHAALIEDGPLLELAADGVASDIPRVRRLHLIDLETGITRRPLEDRRISTSLLAWNPASDALLIAALDGDAARLILITADGRTQDITPSGMTVQARPDFHGSLTGAAAWLGDRPVVRGLFEGHEGWITDAGGVTRTIDGLSAGARLTAQGADALLFTDATRLIRVAFRGDITDLGEAATVVRADGPLGQRALVDPMDAPYGAIRDADGRLCRISADPGSTGPCAPGRSPAAVSWGRGLSVATGASGRGLNTGTSGQKGG